MLLRAGIRCGDELLLTGCSQTKGPGERGPPEIIQKFRLRNWSISSADFPMTPMEGTEDHFGSF